jgi:hypothetical protein
MRLYDNMMPPRPRIQTWTTWKNELECFHQILSCLEAAATTTTMTMTTTTTTNWRGATSSYGSNHPFQLPLS